MARVRETDMLLFRDIVSDLFACLGPLRACEEPIQNRIVDPMQEYVFDPFVDYCADPVRHALAINPCACIPGLGNYPSLPQYDSPAQQDTRTAQVARAKRLYQYNYTLVRTYHIEEGQPVQGRGIAILDSVPMEQLPSMCWVILVLQQALVVVDNLLLILETLEQQQQQVQRAASVGVTIQPGWEMESVQLQTEGGGELPPPPQVPPPDPQRFSEDSEADLASAVKANIDPEYDFYTRPEELARHRNEIQALRANLLGTLVWGKQLSANLRQVEPADAHPADHDPATLRTPAPPAEQQNASTSGGIFGGFCPCPRCSPENITREVYDRINHALQEIVYQIMSIPALNARPYSLKAYNDLFQRIALPQFALWFQSDEMFALQRVAGQNPVVLERIAWDEQISEKFPVTDEQYREVMGDDDSLEDAGLDGRLYLCDYEKSLGNLTPGNWPTMAGQKYVFAPMGLFALQRNNRCVMKPVAIQCGQNPDENPVLTPPLDDDDPRRWNWEIGKTILQNAECNDSEFYRHLGLGHLLTEAFILATYRALPRNHPLYLLLTPNFEGTLFTNNTAVTSINVPDSYLNITDMIFAGNIPATLGIAGNAVADVDFTENMIFNDLRNRGVDDPYLLPNYPYRDDGLLIWDCIHRWATNYVCLYYQDDCDVTGDYELQNWVMEVSAKQGGRIRGVGDVQDGRIVTRDYLIDCMAQVIFTASAHHALTNFPLEDYELYEPGWPGALYQDKPESDRGATRRDWLGYLSFLNIAILQQALGFTIGSVYFTKLGYYPVCHFSDPRVAGPLAQFQADLANAEQTINARNQTRVMRYPYLLPSRIPASTNI